MLPFLKQNQQVFSKWVELVGSFSTLKAISFADLQDSPEVEYFKIFTTSAKIGLYSKM